MQYPTEVVVSVLKDLGFNEVKCQSMFPLYQKGDVLLSVPDTERMRELHFNAIKSQLDGFYIMEEDVFEETIRNVMINRYID